MKLEMDKDHKNPAKDVARIMVDQLKVREQFQENSVRDAAYQADQLTFSIYYAEKRGQLQASHHLTQRRWIIWRKQWEAEQSLLSLRETRKCLEEVISEDSACLGPTASWPNVRSTNTVPVHAPKKCPIIQLPTVPIHIWSNRQLTATATAITLYLIEQD